MIEKLKLTETEMLLFSQSILSQRPQQEMDAIIQRIGGEIQKEQLNQFHLKHHCDRRTYAYMQELENARMVSLKQIFQRYLGEIIASSSDLCSFEKFEEEGTTFYEITPTQEVVEKFECMINNKGDAK